MPFTHTLSPVIVSFGPFALRWYSLVYVAGFLAAYWLLRRVARDGRIANLDEEGVESFMVWLIIGTILGARLAYALVYNPSYFLVAPWKLLFLWEGGMSFHGGFLGAILAGWRWTWRHRVPFFALADLLTLPLSLALVFGRIANFVNGELVGRIADPSSLPWCVIYPSNPGIVGCRHPSQLYGAFHHLLMFVILFPLYLNESFRSRLKDGTLFWLFITLYGFGRLVTDLWRAPDPTDFTFAATGLIVGQWLSLLMGLVGVAGVFLLYRLPLTTHQQTKNKITNK